MILQIFKILVLGVPGGGGSAFPKGGELLLLIEKPGQLVFT